MIRIIISVIAMIIMTIASLYMGYLWCQIKICKAMEKLWWDLPELEVDLEKTDFYDGIRYVDAVLKKVIK